MIEQVKEEHSQMSIEKLCELMSVSRSWYYERPTPGEKAAEDVQLRDAIERIVLEFPGYGYRRVTATLRREGWSVNHKRVLRIMRQESLLCQLKRRFKVTTDSAHPFRRYPNLIKDAEIDDLDQAWIADITYIRLPTTFCYLAAILDAYSRKCVGWHLSRFIDTRLTVRALEMALATRWPAVGVIHHSDQGVQGGFNWSSQHRPREVLLWDDHRAGPHGSRDARPYVLRVLRGSAISASASESSGMPSLRDSAARMPERGSASQVQSQLVGSAILAG